MASKEAFLIQEGAYIDASPEEMIQEYGSVEGYVREGLGLSQQEISRLRDELLE
jgi:protein tyrosine/serine phosphatase